MKLTITEALAEIKTIQARIQKKQESIAPYFVRDSRVKDPLEKEGGTREFVRRERQAISDLMTRWVRLRTAIQRSNVATSLTVGDRTQVVADWLNWRRDVSEKERGWANSLLEAVHKVREDGRKQNLKLTTDDNTTEIELIIAVDELELAKDVEKLEQVLGELDGRLSLMNARTEIEID